MVTCKSRQTIESPGEAGVGSILTAVAVGCEVPVGVTGVTDSPVEEQAASISKQIKLLTAMFRVFFMLE